jgi:hypothetical protein
MESTGRDPNLGIFEVAGSRNNNVILAQHRACHNFAPFVDTKPGVSKSQRYKALGGTGAPGLVALVSEDGIHWQDLQTAPVLTQGAFDSQNVAFWSSVEQCYVCFFRIFKDGVRWISRSTSQDFIHWTEPVELGTDGRPRQHLYTNQLQPYSRAPQFYIGTPTRFMPGRRALGDKTLTSIGTPTAWNYHQDCADIMLISARAGDDLRRTFLEAFLRPGRDPRNWTSRASYSAYGIHQTGADQLTFYVQHNTGYPTTHVRRYSMRVDGFSSVNAPFSGGQLLTRPIRFTGQKLTINYSTSAAGGIRAEIQDAVGQPVPGFELDRCPEILGDQIEREVTWSGVSDLSALSGQPIRLRFVLRDADLYSLKFIP